MLLLPHHSLVFSALQALPFSVRDTYSITSLAFPERDTSAHAVDSVSDMPFL